MSMHKRKKYFIDVEFQTKIILKVVCMILATIILSGIFSYTIAVYIEKSSEIQLYGATDKYKDDIVTVTRFDVVRPVILRSLLIAGFLSIILAGFFMLFYSHRVAGPIHHLQLHLENILNGRAPEKLTFRKHDEFKKLANTINRILKYLDKEQTNENQ